MAESIKHKVLSLIVVALFGIAAVGIGVVASNGQLLADAQTVELVCGGSPGGGCWVADKSFA